MRQISVIPSVCLPAGDTLASWFGPKHSLFAAVCHSRTMSESTTPPAASGVGNPDPSAAGVYPADPAQWEALAAQMAKQGGMQGFGGSIAIPGFPVSSSASSPASSPATPRGNPETAPERLPTRLQQFMYPINMMPGLLSGYGLPAEGELKAEGQGSGEVRGARRAQHTLQASPAVPASAR